MARTTVILNDELLDEAKRITGEKVTSRVLNAALEALVRKEKLKEAAALRGSEIVELTNEEIEELANHE